MNGRPDENPSMSMTATLGWPSERITSPLLRFFALVSAIPSHDCGVGSVRWSHIRLHRGGLQMRSTLAAVLTLATLTAGLVAADRGGTRWWSFVERLASD